LENQVDEYEEVGNEVENRQTITSIMPKVVGRVDVDKMLTGLSQDVVTRQQ
jgi:hypothetical protein